MLHPDWMVTVVIDSLAETGDLEWHVITGGSHRGGLAFAHGYIKPSPEELDRLVDRLCSDVKELIMGHLAEYGGMQLRLPEPH